MSSRFKWKIVEYNGTEQAIVDYCKNFMTSVCTYGKNGKNKLFTPPNPYIDYNNDYSFSYYEEQQDVEYKRRGDLAFKAVKDGYADIVLTTIPEKYSHSNFCVYFAPAKFLDEKIEEAMNDKNELFSLDPDNISDDIEWICQDTKKYLDILNDGKQFPVMCGYNYTLQNVSDMAKQSNYQLKHKQKLVQNKR